MKTTAVCALLLLEVPLYLADNDTSISTFSTNSFRESRGMMHDEKEEGVFLEPKSKPWLGYYDFLITEGSYKFWVVFELFTAGLLIYSVFAAIYYAKYTLPDYDDYEDYFFRRRNGRSIQNNEQYLTKDSVLNILQTLADLHDKYSENKRKR